MPRHPGRALALGVAAVAVALASLPAASSAAPPAIAAVPAIVVTPSTGLVSGQVVTVTGSGFTPSAQVVLSDCLTSTTIGYCGGTPADSLIADGSGNFTYQFRVARGAFDESVYPPPLVDCAQAPGLCSVFAFVGLPVQKASAPISFDPNVAPPSATVTVTPSGTVVDGETLHVAGTGFPPDTGVLIGQCALGARADLLASPCAFPGGVLTPDAQGAVSATVTVVRLYPLVFASGGPNVVDCAAAPGICFVRVTSVAEPLDTVDTPLVFPGAPPVTAAPAFTG